MSTTTSQGPPYHLPPPRGAAPGPDRILKVTFLHPADLPFTLFFHADGKLSGEAPDFFEPGPFPAGSFGQGSVLTGYIAKPGGREAKLLFEYQDDDGKDLTVEILVVLTKPCHKHHHGEADELH